MAAIAGVRHFQSLGQHWRNELEGVAAHIDVCDLSLDLRHVASDALAALAGCRMMRVLFQFCGMRSILGLSPDDVTVQTKLVPSDGLP